MVYDVDNFTKMELIELCYKSTQKNSNGCNVLHIAAHNQTPEAFIKIIDLLSKTSSLDEDRQLLEWLKHVEDLVNQANAEFIIEIFSNELGEFLEEARSVYHR